MSSTCFSMWFRWQCGSVDIVARAAELRDMTIVRLIFLTSSVKLNLEGRTTEPNNKELSRLRAICQLWGIFTWRREGTGLTQSQKVPNEMNWSQVHWFQKPRFSREKERNQGFIQHFLRTEWHVCSILSLLVNCLPEGSEFKPRKHFVLAENSRFVLRIISSLNVRA